MLAQRTVEATAAGYEELADFAAQHATLRAWAIEGTGGHGAGLTRHLELMGELVIELDRPERVQRRHGAKSDPLDAIRAAREALSRDRVATPRSAGDRQALSVTLAARRSAVESSAVAQHQVCSLVIAAPEPIRAKFRGMKLPAMLRTASRLRLHPSWDPETTATVTVLRTLARRAVDLTAEAAAHEKEILRIVRSMQPDLLDQPGVGPINAAVVLCAWSHSGRVHSEAAFAMLGGVAPIPATSGQTVNRHRLNRFGDRQLNRALHNIVLSRLRYGERTRAYADRRTREGRTRRENIRCLKRYVARDLYRLLEQSA